MQEGWIQDCVSGKTVRATHEKLRMIKDEHGELVT